MSAAPATSLLAQLGVAAEDLEELAHVPATKSAVAHGLAGALPPVSSLSELFSDLPVESGTAQRLPFLLTRHAMEPGIVRVEDAPEPVTCAGRAEILQGAVWLDGRAGRESGCVIETADETFVVTVGQQGVTIARLRRATAWTPLPDAFETAPPSLAELLAGRACEGWLRERAAELAASPTLVERAASVGIVVRLWEPNATERAAILAGDAPDPAERASVWIGALGDSRRSLGHLAIHRAASLREAFDGLPERDEDPSDREVLALLYERDALECVRVLLSFVGEGLPLSRALALTDDGAATTWSALAPSERLREDPLLRAVFRSEPDSFWGQLAED